MQAFLFVTDIDNTLIGDDLALQELNHTLLRQRRDFGVKIVYTTDRSLEVYQVLAEAKSLIIPDCLLAAMGTEIYFDLRKKPDPKWSAMLEAGWERNKIIEVAQQFPTLEIQPLSEQNPFKISYYLAQSDYDSTISELDNRLQEIGFNLKFMYRSGQDLDIFPPKLDRGLAIAFIKHQWQLANSTTVACGDSLLDIDLFQAAEKSIIVGNAQPELLNWYQNNNQESIYLAQENFARGVIQGLEHFELGF